VSFNRKPPLKAATNDLDAEDEIGAEYFHEDPPGLRLPEYSVARRSLVSIHAIPASTDDVPGNRTVVV
jgi:hypothetical protein